ncbi:hypothetical protein G6011_04411 [Alternaria panax]|uniref:F-box domain-containing protein n=1 Tax=Alternaria panax TaxID=48097 RepID=A0AAD4NSL4_9PLEO|nr:hypothetical protein G6011_04411 [Alternaria panax]
MPIINERDFPLLPSQDTKRRRAIMRKVKDNHLRHRVPESRATLHELPDELILQILECLPGIDLNHFQLPTLVNLALTSQRLYRVVIGIVYARYNSHFCEPYTFLRTMMSNSQLAEFVQDVDITFGLWTRRRSRRYPPTAKDKKAIKEGLRALGTSNWKEWATQCNEDSSDDEALQNAILLHTPNIASLSILDVERARSRRQAWFDLISRAATGTLPGQTHRFEHLRSIRFEGRMTSLSDVAPLFRLQSLRKLQLREVHESGIERCITCGSDREHGERSALKLERLIPRGCNNLEELDLECTYYIKFLLEVLVSSPRCLKTFRYDVCLDHLPDSPIPSGDRLKTLCEALDGQKATLETLHVFCDSIAEERTRGGIHLRDSLKGFVSLKELSCPLGMLMSGVSDTITERWPASLLTFRTPVRPSTDDQHYLQALDHVAFCHRIYVPRLKEVRVVVSQFASSVTYDWQHLVELFSVETGVMFVVEQDDEDCAFFDWKDDSTDSSRSSDEIDLYSDDD